MKITTVITTFLFLSLTCCGQKGTIANKGLEKQSSLIFNTLDQFPNNTQFALGFVKNGVVEFRGVVKKNGEVKAIDNGQSVFEIGSISKVFTATLLANAVVEEKVSLDDAVNDYLAFDINNAYEFSFLQLANHTSGLPRMPGNFIFHSSDINNPFKDYNEKALREFLERHIKLVDNSTTQYEYSNLGAGLLGYVLTQVYGTSYDKLLTDKIFDKFKMGNSYSNPNQVKEVLVKGQNEKGETTPNWDLNVLIGAGGILSTAEDLSKFMLAQLNSENQELNLTRKETYKIEDKSAIGLGWHIKKREVSKELFWHNGGTGGYRSCMVIDVESKNGIVILSNVSGLSKNAGKIDDLTFNLLKTLD